MQRQLSEGCGMKWTVIGKDMRSGAAAKLTLDAESADAARRRATAGGVDVAEVHPDTGTSSATPSHPGSVVPTLTAINPAVASAVDRIPCPSCAELVLPAAYICPHCKRTIIRDPRIILFGLVAAAVTGIIVWFAIGAWFDHEYKKQKDEIWKDAREQTKQLMSDVQAETDRSMREARQRADEAARKAGGQ